MRTRTVFYMAVTPDEYELPIYIAETIEEMAEKYHISKNTIYSSVCNNRSGKNAGYKFVKVKL